MFSEWFSYDCCYTKAKVITSGQPHQTLIMQRANQNTKQKHTTSAKCGKTCNQYQGQKNMPLVSRAGNMQPVPRAGKHATGAKGRKASNQCQARFCKQDCFFPPPDWLKKRTENKANRIKSLWQ